MPEQRRPESADLTDYEVLDASDTLDGDPGDDPLDRGVAAPQRWSAAIRHRPATYRHFVVWHCRIPSHGSPPGGSLCTTHLRPM